MRNVYMLADCWRCDRIVFGVFLVRSKTIGMQSESACSRLCHRKLIICVCMQRCSCGRDVRNVARGFCVCSSSFLQRTSILSLQLMITFV